MCGKEIVELLWNNLSTLYRTTKFQLIEIDHFTVAADLRMEARLPVTLFS